MNTIIGIISYLPNDDEVREYRLNKLIALIHMCDYLFNLPIYIVIQNYTNIEISKLLESSHNVVCSSNNQKLGILEARRTLRRYFISSNYDNLIMLDDDCTLTGTKDAGNKYLKQVEDNPNCFIEFNNSLLKLFCISKEIFKNVDYENINPELEEGFEDRVFVGKLRKLYADKRRVFERNGLEEYSISTKDKYSTWYTGQNINKMLENTYKYEK